MTALPDFAGWQFEQGIETLRRGFVEAIAAIEGDIRRKQAEILQYEESLKSGAEPIGEWDEEGYKLWDQTSSLEFDISTLESACMALRKAMVIQLYHLWERAARQVLQGEQDDTHAKLVAKLSSAGCVPHPQLQAVQYLVNTLKHGSAKWGDKLALAWPELVSTTIPLEDWYDRVSLSDDNVGKVAEIVAASYPRKRNMSRTFKE